jgi:hypothetical protein
MGRYAVFAGRDYYPNGGWEDLFCVCGSLEEARTHAQIGMESIFGDSWWQIVDLEAVKIVESGPE